jgi:hypothetical protein
MLDLIKAVIWPRDPEVIGKKNIYRYAISR